MACLALAGLSLLVPSAPTTDSWGWIVWGREIVHLDLSTVVGGAPSWKPLPVVFTTPLSLAGGAAAALWMLLARAGALFSLVAAFRLGTRLAGRWAGLLAAGGLVISTDWLRAVAHGYADPAAIGLLLAAVERHLAGRRMQAFLLAGVVGLVRPEAWALVVLYGTFLWLRDRASRPAVAGVVLAVPLLWLLPDWIGSGDPFHASHVARTVVPTGTAAAVEAFKDALRFPPLPFSLAALAAVAIAVRRRDRELLGVAALTIVWTLALFAIMLAGYPGSARYYVLPAGLVCALGAAGAVLLVQTAGTPRARLAVAACLALAALPPLAIRTGVTVGEGGAAIKRAQLESDLDKTIERAGEGRLKRCGEVVLPAGLGWTKGEVAWNLRLPLRRVRAFPSSARRYVRRLTMPHRKAIPPPPRLVVVHARSPRFVLLAPFSGAPIRLVGRRSGPVVTLASAGRWRAVAPRGSIGCGAVG